MKKMYILVCNVLSLLFFTGCSSTGYQKKHGDWVWVTNDENFGVRQHLIVGIDQSSFMVLPNKSFAKDKHQVYYKGKKIKHASAKSFEYLTNSEYGYAKDNLHAYFDNEVILTADPKSFKVLEFPYSCDANDVYCGTLPMRLTPKEVAAFKVTNTDKWLKGTKNIMALNHFLELHPQYNWITTLNIEIENVIIGSGGTAETLDKKFIGINETH